MKVLTKNNFQRVFSSPIGTWHRWFAWKPVRTWDGRRVWLKLIKRRLQQVYEYCGQDGGYKTNFQFDENGAIKRI